MADPLLGGYLHIVWQSGMITIGFCAFLFIKLVKDHPLRRIIHMSLGVIYTGGLIIGFVWGVLSIWLLFKRVPFQTLHGIVGIVVITLILVGASLGLSIHFLKKRVYLVHFIIQFTGLLLATIQIVLGMTIFLIIG